MIGLNTQSKEVQTLQTGMTSVHIRNIRTVDSQCRIYIAQVVNLTHMRSA